MNTHHATRLTFLNLIIFIVCAIAFAASAAFAFTTFRTMQTQTRGVTYSARPEMSFGINASLEKYSDADLQRALALIRDGGFKIVRQHFYWSDIEPRKNEFDWTNADRIVARANENNLQIIAVIDTTPVWARHPGEADLLNAPPADMDDYARFVAAFAERYANRVQFVQVWDNPNVHPFWGRRNADPIEYTQMLRATAIAVRAANANIKIISAGLAANGELIREHPDYSDVLFLRGMYQAGAKDYFDFLGAKAYGMWTGPDDRRVDMSVINFSRVILLRDEMLAYGDGNKPVWAVEFGWNALPSDWRGAASPWGSDTEAVQSKRLADAIQRAKSEWGWMSALFAQTFQPNASADDPQWGFAFVDQNFQPRAFYNAAKDAMLAPVAPASFDFARFYATLAALGIIALVALTLGVRAAWHLPWEKIWSPLESRFTILPELAQLGLLALAVAVFYYAPNAILNFALLAVIVFLFALRLDLGLAITVFAIPFYLLPKNMIGGAQFSLVEILTLASVVAFAIRTVMEQKGKGAKAPLATRGTQPRLRFTFHALDFAVLAFVLLGMLSVKLAANFGVAMRELRVIVIEPALLYALIRVANLSRRDLFRLVNAFILSAVAISLIALYQYFFTDWVIVGEGVRRVLAVYGSPNNLALYLDRALPIVVALLVFTVRDVTVSKTEPARIGWVDWLPRIYSFISAILIAVALYLTFSRGAWLGIAAGLACIGYFSDKRIRFALVGLFIIGAILLVPFLQTERAQSLFQAGTGTGFFRVSVWQSAIAMIHDHPLFGVGLDNFLYTYPQYIQPSAWREPNLSHPHNIVLDFWARLGIGGVVVMAWMVMGFYREGIRELKELRERQEMPGRALVIGLMASMTAALAHGLIDAAYFYVDLAFVWMLTLGIIAQLTNKR